MTFTENQKHWQDGYDLGFRVGYNNAPPRFIDQPLTPVPMRLTCPTCSGLHVDEGKFKTQKHHTHACEFCGMVWRPAVVDTVGVQFLPGMKMDVDDRQ